MYHHDTNQNSPELLSLLDSMYSIWCYIIYKRIMYSHFLHFYRMHPSTIDTLKLMDYSKVDVELACAVINHICRTSQVTVLFLSPTGEGDLYTRKFLNIVPISPDTSRVRKSSLIATSSHGVCTGRCYSSVCARLGGH